ncbi:MAG: M15 family metallopeptidase [Eubacteriales bacterium]|nr:M15 family metallopeptidase [Eubacteriales bacterium]
MRKKKMMVILLSCLLFLSICDSQVSASTPPEEEEFVWDEETKDDAVYVWQANEWERWQDRLTLSGFIPESAHAKVNSKVRALEGKVKEVLADERTYGYGQDNGLQHPTEYTEIILAMIQVLAQDEGLFNDGGCTQKEFDEWTKTMGQYVSNTHRGDEWTTEESIYQIFLKFTASGQMMIDRYKASGNEEKAKFPSVFEITDALKAVIEGTVMHYRAIPNYSQDAEMYYSGMYVRYTVSTAKVYGESKHKDDLESYYEVNGIDYIPSPSFADDVISIYTVSAGYGDLAGLKSKQEVLNYLFPNGVPSSESEMRKYLTTITVPIWNGSGQSTMSLTVHKKLTTMWTSIFKDLTAIRFPIKPGETSCYSYRQKNGGSGLSSHAYGSTIDINYRSNPQIQPGHNTGGTYAPGSDPYSVTPEVVKLFKKYGFAWGGDWKSKKDYMHFSLTKD